DDPQMGENKAKVTIVEFSDFECPYCAKFHQQTFPQIKKDYIDTGKVRFIYRDFPLPFHNHAQKAAEASECADEQGKYWEYHNLLFENYDSLSVENLKKFASDLKLDTAKFNTCLDSGKMSSEVSKDSQEGQGYGVSGTPAFFVNGKLLTGAQPFAVFQQAIEAELGK
ncbi:MAG: DsbA family protein, partial [Nanoarchaeota archaeon]